jgi:hypothetical protein
MLFEKQRLMLPSRTVALSSDLLKVPAIQAAVDLNMVCSQDNIFYRVAGSTAKILIAAEVRGTIDGIKFPRDVDVLVDRNARTRLETGLGELGYKKITKTPRQGEHLVAVNNRYLYVKTGPDGQEKVLDLTFGSIDQDNGTAQVPLAPYLPRIFKDKRPTLCRLVFSQTMLEGVDYVIGKNPQDVVTAFNLAALIFGFEALMQVREIGDPEVAKRQVSLEVLRALSTSDTESQKERIVHDYPSAGLYLRENYRWPLATATNPGALGVATNIIKSFRKRRHG